MKVTSLNKKAQKTQCSSFALTLPLSLPLPHVRFRLSDFQVRGTCLKGTLDEGGKRK